MIFYGFQDRSFKDRTSHDVQQYRVTLKQKLGIIQSLFGSLGSCNKEKIVAQSTFCFLRWRVVSELHLTEFQHFNDTDKHPIFSE